MKSWSGAEQLWQYKRDQEVIRGKDGTIQLKSRSVRNSENPHQDKTFLPYRLEWNQSAWELEQKRAPDNLRQSSSIPTWMCITCHVLCTFCTHSHYTGVPRTLGSRYHVYPHFTGKEPTCRRVRPPAQGHRADEWQSGIWTQVIWLRSLCTFLWPDKWRHGSKREREWSPTHSEEL